ncbi:MAG: hypothetical protein M1831_001295 [Alyxoria varia]|nr:MAG: hypothetical protein M1831_001295 [Alyxoria varia]
MSNPIHPHFWRQPIRYMRWASHEHPALFWSVMIGSMGPVLVIFNRPVRNYMGWERRPRIPMTYPGEYLFLNFPGWVVCDA